MLVKLAWSVWYYMYEDTMWHNERKFIWVTEKKVMIENGRVMSVHVQHELWTYIRSVKVLRHPICVYIYMLIFTNILYLQQELLIAWFQIFANFDIYKQYCNEFWGTLYDVNTIISSARLLPILSKLTILILKAMLHGHSHTMDLTRCHVTNS